MPKAVMYNHVYIDIPDDDVKKKIFDSLTYRIASGMPGSPYENIETVRTYRMITPKIIAIPVGRMDLVPAGYEIVDKRITVPVEFPDPKFPLLDEQRIIYDQVEDSCFINAMVGWGKTFTALHIARKLGQKTLVVVHTAALRDQWCDEVEKLFGIKAGIIGDGKFQINSQIVIGNVQSLVKVIPHIEKAFGTVITDEAHHTPATTFTITVDRNHARYRIALSGTMERKDGKHVMFKDWFGPIVHRPPKNNTVDPSILMMKVGRPLPFGKTWAEKMTALAYDDEYQQLVAGLAKIQADKGHKVLVISDRVQLLQKVTELLGSRAVVITGETKERDKLIEKIMSGECDVLSGSRQIFSEGISVNPLSCLILATPIANPPTLEQIIGRIQRIYPGKLDPLVIDLCFQNLKNQEAQRIGLYAKRGWKMQRV